MQSDQLGMEKIELPAHRSIHGVGIHIGIETHTKSCSICLDILQEMLPKERLI